MKKRKQRKIVKCSCGHKIITEFVDVLYWCGTYDVYECIMCGKMSAGYPK